MKKEENKVTRSSGNIFADLNIENPEEYQLKAKLARLVNNAIKKRGWTQKHSAEVLGIQQPHVSDLHRGLLDRFSVEKLIQFLGKLDHHVTLTVSSDKDDLPPHEIVIAARKLEQEGNVSQNIGSSL